MGGGLFHNQTSANSKAKIEKAPEGDPSPNFTSKK
jgi:hypothetical protein